MTNALKQYVAQRPTSIVRLDKDGAISRPDWELADALLGGTPTMREAGERYLPRFPAEEVAGYNARLARTTLYNVFKRTISVLAAKPFQAPPVLDRAASTLVDWMDNVDLQGRNLINFAKETLRIGLAKGMAHLFIDFPRASPGATLADERAANRRPYLVLIRPEDVLGFVADKVNGYERLIALRLAATREQADPKDEFSSVTVEQRLEIKRGEGVCPWQLKEKGPSDQDFVLVAGGVLTVPEIPLVTFYAQREGFMQASSPLIDLAHLNVEHWQSSSDQNNILHVARVPFLFASGFADNDDIVVGTQAAVRTTNPEARLAYVEHSGAAVEAGRASLQDLEARMAALGAELLLKRQTGDKTATEAAIESAEATCDLAAIVEALEDAFNIAIEFMGTYVGAKTLGTVTFFKDFAVDGLSAADLDVLLRMNAAGVVSKETVFKEAQRRKVVSDEIDYETEQDLIEEEDAAALDNAVQQAKVMGAAGGDGALGGV